MAGVETRALPEGQILYFQISDLLFLPTVVFGMAVRSTELSRGTIDGFGKTNWPGTKFAIGPQTGYYVQGIGGFSESGSMSSFNEMKAR